MTLHYLDLHHSKKGRTNCKVVKTWLSEHKFSTLLDSVYCLTNVSSLSLEEKTIIHQGNAHTIDRVADIFISWLNSFHGRYFLANAFDIRLPYLHLTKEQIHDSRMFHLWKTKYKKATLEHLFYQHGFDSKLHATWIHTGSPETAEVVCDTLIGWLNTYRGRYFIKEAFDVDMHMIAADGSH